ncbi:MAG: SH3 domain-containing protein [Oscillospiraceae bacterium]|nr:SH3 domain-containing protein [Oscillospiraceae bacterium]
MKKRMICALLAAVMLIGMVAVSAVSVNAAAMATSTSGVNLIKQLEGFQKHPTADYGRYSVGYGSSCGKDDYPNGITEAEAETLLRRDLAAIETRLNSFASGNGLTFTQAQFDALASFTYNVGIGWMSDSEGMFRAAVVNGSKGNDFLFAITRWSSAGEAVQLGLVQRRLAEANLYLNGVYSKGYPANFTYVLYNNNLPEVSNTIKVQAYDSVVGDKIKSEPARNGYTFLGWYTAASGGQAVTRLDASTAELELFAHWQKGEGEVDANGDIVGVAASYTMYAAPDGSSIVYRQPSVSSEKLKTLEANAEIAIVAEYVDMDAAKWGRIADGGWICLGNAYAEIQPTDMLKEPLVVIVNANSVNVRFGPGTSYAKIGKVFKGQELTIVGTQRGGQYLWGKYDGGWICLDYTNYETALAERNMDSDSVIGIGTVVKASRVNIRSGPGTSYAKAGTVTKGSTLQLLGQTEVKGKIWYKITTGWICSDYVEVTPVVDGGSDDQKPTEPTQPEKPAEPTEPTPTEPEPTKPGTSTGGNISGDKTEVIDTGTIVNCSTLRIRAGAGTGYECIGKLACGEKVEIYDYTLVRGTVWGKISLGWICMNYVQIHADASSEDAVMATVVNCTKVNVRAGAGTGYAKVASLPAGTRVQVLQLLQLSNGKVWARVSQGWIHTDYLKLDVLAEDPSGSTDTGSGDSGAVKPTEPSDKEDIVVGETSEVIIYGVIYKTNTLRVRSGPGSGYRHIGDVAAGTRVEILEIKHSGVTTWGRTAQGWISLYYVQLEKNTSAAGAFTGTVCASNLAIRAGAGVEFDQLDDYRRGNKIVILETVSVGTTTWGRTEDGWVCMDYVK